LRRHSGDEETRDLASGASTGTGVAADSGPVADSPATVDVAHFVSALARAVHAFHTYPPGSPARVEVLERAREALQPCLPDEGSCLLLDVTNEGLKHDDRLVHDDRGPERSLAIALRRAYVSDLEFHRGAPIRDFRQLCGLLAFPDRLIERVEGLAEILAARGVSLIGAHVIATHRTIEAGTVPKELLQLVARNRETTPGGSTPGSAEGGWIRLDPSVPLDRVGIEDLPVLLRDAPSLGMALHQMAGGSPESTSPAGALLRHYGEITELYAATEASVAEALFRRLADTVRQLPEPIRETLLRDEVLPGLVDGRGGERVLKHFDDDEIADALTLLLDLGVGGMEMLTAGLARLELPESRRPAVLERVSRRLETPDSGASRGIAAEDTAVIREDADDVDRRLKMDDGHDADYVALHAFDLAVDESAAVELAAVAREVAGSDPLEDNLRSCLDILRLSADPSVIGSTVRRARGLFFGLESRGEAGRLARWLADFASLARARMDQDEDVASRIRSTLDEYVTPEFIHRVSAMPPTGEGEPPLVTIICELGATGVGVLVDSLASESDLSARNRLLLALQPRAPELAEHLVPYLSHPKWFVVRNVLSLLGHGGPGWEKPIADSIDHAHDRVVREAFLALARIGSRTAASHVARALRHDSRSVRRHAGETIWRFDPRLSRPLLHAALLDRELVARDPELIRELVAAAGRRDLDGLRPTLRRLRWHCLAVWSPTRRALGRAALRQLRSAR
jgi:hypothetical protein